MSYAFARLSKQVSSKFIHNRRIKIKLSQMCRVSWCTYNEWVLLKVSTDKSRIQLMEQKL